MGFFYSTTEEYDKVISKLISNEGNKIMNLAEELPKIKGVMRSKRDDSYFLSAKRHGTHSIEYIASCGSLFICKGNETTILKYLPASAILEIFKTFVSSNI